MFEPPEINVTHLEITDNRARASLRNRRVYIQGEGREKHASESQMESVYQENYFAKQINSANICSESKNWQWCLWFSVHKQEILGSKKIDKATERSKVS